MEVGNCYLGLRNHPPVLIKIVHLTTGEISVFTDIGGGWTNCFSSYGWVLPTNYYFGFSAATGDLADDHDVYGFAVRNLDTNAKNIDAVTQFSLQQSPFFVSGLLSKIDYKLSEPIPVLNCPVNNPPSQVANQAICDTSSLNKDVESVKGSFINFQSSVDEILRTVQSIQHEYRNRKDSPSILATLSTIRNTLHSIQQSSKKLEDNTSTSTIGNILWIFFGIIIISILIYILRVFYAVRSEKKNEDLIFK